MKAAGKLRILYIEDEPLARWTGVRLIESLGVYVTEADGVARGRELWMNNEFDLVLSDYRLEDGTALDLIGEMRSRGKAEPVAVLTAEEGEFREMDRESLGIRAVLGKPLDRDKLAAVMDGLGESAVEAGLADVGGGESAVFDVPIWVSPAWGIAHGREAGEAAGLLVARGAGEDVWVIGYECGDGGAREKVMETAMRNVFGVLARWMPGESGAADLLDRCVRWLAGGADPDREWSLQVAHLSDGGVEQAFTGAELFDCFFSDADGAWARLGVGAGRPTPARRLIIVRSPAGAAGMEDAWDALKSGGAPAGARGAVGFWRGSVGRNIVLNMGSGAGGDTIGLLRGVESALLADGVEPVFARMLGCGIFDLVENGYGGSVSLAWQSGLARIEINPRGAPAREFARFFSRIESGTDATALFVEVRPEAGGGRRARRLAGRGGAAGAAKGFYRVSAPELLDEQAALAIERECGDFPRVALDFSAAAYIGSRALSVFAAMSAERRGAAGGGGLLCIVNYSSLIGALLARLGMDMEVDMAAFDDELESAARRLTSLSERASLMASVVERGDG